VDRGAPAGRRGRCQHRGDSAVAAPRKQSAAPVDAALVAEDDPLWRRCASPGSPAVTDRGPARSGISSAFGDPRDPGALRQAWLARSHPNAAASWSASRRRSPSCAGDGIKPAAPTSPKPRDSPSRHPPGDPGVGAGERRLRGTRYKVPRFVYEDILGRPAFRGGSARLAAHLGRSEGSVQGEAARDLREIAATHSPFVIDLTARLIHLLYTRGYSEALHYDRGQLAQNLRPRPALPAGVPATHKSNLDIWCCSTCCTRTAIRRTTRRAAST